MKGSHCGQDFKVYMTKFDIFGVKWNPRGLDDDEAQADEKLMTSPAANKAFYSRVFNV